MKRFSIITVALNEERTIRQTCESICAQECDDYEWIVIDGGSTDGTLAILEDYREHITHLSSEPDEGIYDAMNKGVARASGTYLVFMNAGDAFCDAQVLARVAREAPSREILYGDLLCQAADGSRFVKTFPDTLPGDFLVDSMLPHQASFFHRELFERYGGYDTSYRIAGDYELFVRFVHRQGASCWHLPFVVAVFGTDGISSGREHRRLRQAENHRVRKHYFSWSLYGWKRLENELKFWFRCR